MSVSIAGLAELSNVGVLVRPLHSTTRSPTARGPVSSIVPNVLRGQITEAAVPTRVAQQSGISPRLGYKKRGAVSR